MQGVSASFNADVLFQQVHSILHRTFLPRDDCMGFAQEEQQVLHLRPMFLVFD